jgi:hypothetical protein
MDRDTLIAALVGAGIATIPILITSIVQIIIHISENRQKRREAKIQAREKWIERDVLKCMELVEAVVRLRGEIKRLDLRINRLENLTEPSHFTEDEISTRLKTLHENKENLFVELGQAIDKLGILVQSFGDGKIFVKSQNLYNTLNKFNEKDETVTWAAIATNAGKFHEALRDLLISLRE